MDIFFLPAIEWASITFPLKEHQNKNIYNHKKWAKARQKRPQNLTLRSRPIEHVAIVGTVLLLHLEL
jgi:hypothetical protein